SRPPAGPADRPGGRAATRETAAISVGPGPDPPERAPACLLAGQAGAAAAAGSAHHRPRPGETSRRVIDPAGRPHAPAAGSGPAGSPGTAHARETAGTGPWLPPGQAPEGGADVTGLARMTRWTRARLDGHRRRYAGAGGAIGVSGGMLASARARGRSG